VEDAGSGIYVYGVVSREHPLPHGPGIDGVHPLSAIAWREVCAVVSQVALAEFGEMPLHQRLQDLRWLADTVRAHEVVVEQVMRQQTVLPCQFCTIYRSEGRVREVLARYYHHCREGLAFLHDKEEWGVKAYIAEKILQDHLLQTDHDLSGLEREGIGKSPGFAYLLQKTVQQRLLARVEHTRARLRVQLTRALQVHAVRAEELSPAALRLSPSETCLLLSMAYLLAKERVEAFAACIQALNTQIASEGARLVLSGPWPPYHFSPRCAPVAN